MSVLSAYNVLLAFITIFIYVIVTYNIIDKTVFDKHDKRFAHVLHLVCFIVFCLLMIAIFSNVTMINTHNQSKSQYTMKPLNE